MSCFPIHIKFKEESGLNRVNEPVSMGIHIPYGQLPNTNGLKLRTSQGWPLPLGCTVLGQWPDKSIRHLIIDSQVSIEPKGQCMVELSCTGVEAPKALEVKMETAKSHVFIHTGPGQYGLGTGQDSSLIQWVKTEGKRLAMARDVILLEDFNGDILSPRLDTWELIHDTPLKKELLFKGRFAKGQGRFGPEFDLRFGFYTGKPWLKMEFTLRNPKPAIHRQGAWDFGDENSYFFREVSVGFEPDAKVEKIRLSRETGVAVTLSGEDLSIFQASSGQLAWDCRTHVNARGEIPLEFRGYRLYNQGEKIDQGNMADPWVAFRTKGVWISCYSPFFWQNFPKSMAVNEKGIRLGLFPKDHKDGFELLPGEQKTHTIYLSVCKDPEQEWAWAKSPLTPTVDNLHFLGGAMPPAWGAEVSESYDSLAEKVLSHSYGFEAKNRVIDEYGWRNFGDVWADHESIMSENPLVSHYNNQYDLIKGMILQFRRSGNCKWFRLARQMADHVVDIDIYHTDEDKPQYNRGLFWHTDHHLDASTAGHRTISIDHKDLKPPGSFGGGPAPDHNYATGLLYLYWMTGDFRYKTAVLDLAENVIQWFTAPHTVCEWALMKLKGVHKRMRGSGAIQGAYNAVFRFNGPSRVSGNSLNTLIDAFLATGENGYLNHAEQVISTAVSLEDDCDQMELTDSENRWMYLVFLSALGRYLDVKISLRQRDRQFNFARSVLVNYAEWMARAETPFLSTPDTLEFPTETWAAQDIRKADVFAWAFTYSIGEQKEKFLERCRFFYSHSLTELSSFETCHFTRPMAVILSNGLKAMEVLSDPCSVPDLDLGTVPEDTTLSGRPMQRKSPDAKKFIKAFSLKRELKWMRLLLRSK